MDWPEIVRSGSIFLSLVCIGLLLRKYFKYWDQYQTGTKDFWWVLFCWCSAIVLGSIEVLLGWDTQFRSLFIFFAVALTLKLLLKPNEFENPTFTNEF